MSDGIKLKDANGDSVVVHADEVVVQGVEGKVERTKVGWGAPDSYADVDAAHPLPVTDPGLQGFVDQLEGFVDGLEANTSGLATQTTLDLIRIALQGTLVTRQAGTYSYRAGVAPATVDVPDSGRVTRISVVAGLLVSATITIGGGDVITVPAGQTFDEQLSGSALGSDIVITGSVQSFYVAWVV